MKYYQELIKSIEDTLCGDLCTNCKDYNNCEHLNSVLSQSILYFFKIYNSIRDNFLVPIFFNCIQDQIDLTIENVSKNKIISGENISEKEIRKLLAYLYYIFYYTNKNEEINFNSYVVDTCLKQYNLDLICMQDTDYANVRVYFWQEDDSVLNIFDKITPSYYITKSNKSLLDFRSGYTIPNNIIGRLVILIPIAEESLFTLEDSLGNNITHLFSRKNSDNIVIFVSNEKYVESDIYIKIR